MPDEETSPLWRALETALSDGDGADLTGLADLEPFDERDALLALHTVHDLHLAPIERLAGAERWQHHPAVAGLKWRLEADLIASLDADDATVDWALPDEPVAAVRAVAALGLVPDLYRWVAEDATAEAMITFLALEGGPDGGFDDLVATCQIGLAGEAKLEMARNYWDEMGNGTADRVHTELHRKLVRSLDMPVVAPAEQPVELLRRSALNGLLGTNRALQPEMTGALGLLELQAGPRCRQVLAGLRRLGADDDALDFYDEHAVADPRHGKDWLDKVVATLAADARFATGMVRGARWRSLVNARFFEALARRLVPERDWMDEAS